MNRYTFFTDDYPVVTCDHCYEDQNENYCGPAIERLAEYEATGLMPAEVASLQYQLRHARGGQRWIPVEESLPKTIPCNAGTAYSEAVNVLTSGRKVLTAIWDGKDFIADAEFWEAEDEVVTHWTPVLLPLPKEESHG